MIKRKYFISAVLAVMVLFLLASCGLKEDYTMTVAPMRYDYGNRPTTHIINPDSEVRGVWIASVYNIDYPSKTDLSAEKLQAEIDAILDTCTENNLNTIFFHFCVVSLFINLNECFICKF